MRPASKAAAHRGNWQSPGTPAGEESSITNKENKIIKCKFGR